MSLQGCILSREAEVKSTSSSQPASSSDGSLILNSNFVMHTILELVIVPDLRDICVPDGHKHEFKFHNPHKYQMRKLLPLMTTIKMGEEAMIDLSKELSDSLVLRFPLHSASCFIFLVNSSKVNKIPKMLTRQSANLKRSEKMAEEQQSGNGCASTGEVYMYAEKVKGAISAINLEIPRKTDQKKQNRDQEIHAVDNIQGSTEVNNGAKRKRGRPKSSDKHIGERSTRANVDMKDSHVGDEAKSSAEVDILMSTTADEIPKIGVFQPFSMKLVAVTSPIIRKPRKGAPRRKRVIRELEGQADETINQAKNSVSNGHGELSKSNDTESQYQDSHEVDLAKHDGMMIDEDDDTDDDLPLSMCLNIRPPIGSDDSRTLPVGKQDGYGTPPIDQDNTMKSSVFQKTDGPRDIPDLNQCPESNDEGGELGPPAIVSTLTMENKESFPFVKRSPVWETISSIETYKKMRMKPHFHPLKKHEEKAREGLALSLMVTFFNLVEDISKLQSSSDITEIESCLKSLSEYKPHGFEVDKVEAVLTQLLLKKQMAEELRKEYEHIGSKISNSVDEGKLKDEEISQLRQKIREIEKELGEAILKKENREKALSALQSERDAVAENLESVGVEFETIAASLK
ncbi:hypothetical protein POM88_032701 [Heracleum sosnowskyi]|uniref:Uncharacterized protein n=1 Tax=Heracleum sosnowskyi TaxID=360622 RepID=A0AAD8I0N9_9APIA|nr:hypothetical protein POM88_032701 [Heracleum sosnowskyi]